MAEATPKPGADAPVTDDASAVAHVASLLEPEGPPPQEADEQPEATREEPEAGTEEKSEAQTSSEQEAEGKPEDSEGGELPDTLNGFAEALGMEPADLAGHIRVPIKLDGKVEEVTIAELMRGHHREADYTRKTMELAEQRKHVEAQQQQALERWQQEFQRLNEAIQGLEDDVGTDPDPQILEDDPQEYLRLMAKQQKQKQRLEQARTARDEALQKQQAEQQQRVIAYRTEQQRLLSETMPEVSNAENLAKFETDMQSYLGSLGYSGEEIGGFMGGAFDHRHVLIVRDAMRFRALQEGKKTLPKKLGGLAKVQKPGTAPTRRSEEDRIAAGKNRLKQLGRKGTRQQQTDAAVQYVRNLL